MTTTRDVFHTANSDYNYAERAGLLAIWLRQGLQVTSSFVAERFCISQHTARADLTSLSRVLPLQRDRERDGSYRWYWPRDMMNEYPMPRG
jgi:hypothetical protein